VSGPTVIGPILRHVRPARTVASLLKWEALVIDPLGVLGAVLVFEALVAADGRSTLATVALGSAIVGAAILTSLLRDPDSDLDAAQIVFPVIAGVTFSAVGGLVAARRHQRYLGVGVDRAVQVRQFAVDPGEPEAAGRRPRKSRRRSADGRRSDRGCPPSPRRSHRETSWGAAPGARRRS